MVVSDQHANTSTSPTAPPYSPMRTVLAVLLAATPPTTLDPRRYQGRRPVARRRTLTERQLPPFLPERIQPPWTPSTSRLSGDTSTVTRSVLRWAAVFLLIQFAGLGLLTIGESLGLAMDYVQHALLIGMGVCLGAAIVQGQRLLPDWAETPNNDGDGR